MHTTCLQNLTRNDANNISIEEIPNTAYASKAYSAASCYMEKPLSSLHASHLPQQ